MALLGGLTGGQTGVGAAPKSAAPVRNAPIWGGRSTYTNQFLPPVHGGTLGVLQKQGSPQQPGATLPQAPASSPVVAPGAPSTPASPLDSTYYDNLAMNQFKVGNQVNALTAAGQNDTTALQSALGQLAYQQPRDSLKLEQGANRTGGLYSSVYDQNQGNLLNSYQTRQSGLTSANAEKQAAIASQIGGLQQGIPVYDSAQYDAAVGRAAKLAAANPATGQSPGVLPAAPAPGVAPNAPTAAQIAQWVAAGSKPTPAANAAQAEALARAQANAHAAAVAQLQAGPRGLGRLGSNLVKQGR